MTIIVEEGFQGAKIASIEILLPGQRRITRTLKAVIKEYSAVEPAIEIMKMDARPGGNSLKGAPVDVSHTVTCRVGHILRKLMWKRRLLFSATRDELHNLLRLTWSQQKMFGSNAA